MPNSVCSIPKIMGIMNVTPDSFYAKSRTDSNQSINYTKYQNADIVDIGFESSRPGANPLSEKDELNRLFDFLGNVANFKQTLMFKIESCIGFHSFSLVCVFFHSLPRCVNLLIWRGVEPLLTTNY